MPGERAPLRPSRQSGSGGSTARGRSAEQGDLLVVAERRDGGKRMVSRGWLRWQRAIDKGQYRRGKRRGGRHDGRGTLGERGGRRRSGCRRDRRFVRRRQF